MSKLPRVEFCLLAVVVLSVALWPIRITTAYSNLPAHPLLLHVPVMLIPICVIWAIVLAARPDWIQSQGPIVGVIAVVAIVGLVLTIDAGLALRDALHLNGGFGPASLIKQHEHAANLLRIVFYAFTLVLIALLFAYRGGLPEAARMPLRGLLVILAIGSGYGIFHTGDLGAKAVWQGRLGGPPRQFGNGGGFFPSSGPPRGY